MEKDGHTLRKCVAINHQEADANKKCFSDLKKKKMEKSSKNNSDDLMVQ